MKIPEEASVGGWQTHTYNLVSEQQLDRGEGVDGGADARRITIANNQKNSFPAIIICDFLNKLITQQYKITVYYTDIFTFLYYANQDILT